MAIAINKTFGMLSRKKKDKEIEEEDIIDDEENATKRRRLYPKPSLGTSFSK